MDGELNEGEPTQLSTCGNCGKEARYRLSVVTDYGESICPHCHQIFWSTRLLSFAREIRNGRR